MKNAFIFHLKSFFRSQLLLDSGYYKDFLFGTQVYGRQM